MNFGRIFRKEITGEQKKEIKETFEILDKNKENRLYDEDLKTALGALGFQPNEDDFARIKRSFKTRREDRTYFNYQEFFEIVSSRLNGKDSIKDYKILYQSVIPNEQSKINKQTLTEWAEKFNEKLSESDIKDLLDAADFDKDGQIGQYDFITMLKKTQFY